MQVLSATVAHAFEFYGDSDTEETVKFIKMFDKFFDCFNVRCVSESVQKRKPHLWPYRDPCDSRLSVSFEKCYISLWSFSSLSVVS